METRLANLKGYFSNSEPVKPEPIEVPIEEPIEEPDIQQNKPEIVHHEQPHKEEKENIVKKEIKETLDFITTKIEEIDV